MDNHGFLYSCGGYHLNSHNMLHKWFINPELTSTKAMESQNHPLSTARNPMKLTLGSSWRLIELSSRKYHILSHLILILLSFIFHITNGSVIPCIYIPLNIPSYSGMFPFYSAIPWRSHRFADWYSPLESPSAKSQPGCFAGKERCEGPHGEAQGERGDPL